VSKDAGVTHDTAARLIGVSPAELDRLVRAGFIRRNDRNAYSVPVLIENYVAWLKNSFHGTLGHPTQAEVAVHLDLSDRSVREIEVKLGLGGDYTLNEFRVAYIRHLREQAAGRAASGDLDLATERARLAAAQAERVERANAIERGELAPMVLLEQVLAKTAAKVAGVFDGIPGQVRRRAPHMPVEALDVVAAEVAKARNTVAAMSLADLVEEPPEGVEEKPEAAAAAEVDAAE
jgi:phage terminase Nu1 subunit (DNA packaging protein)